LLFSLMSKIFGYYEINDIMHDIIKKFYASIEVFTIICIIANKRMPNTRTTVGLGLEKLFWINIWSKDIQYKHSLQCLNPEIPRFFKGWTIECLSALYAWGGDLMLQSLANGSFLLQLPARREFSTLKTINEECLTFKFNVINRIINKKLVEQEEWDIVYIFEFFITSFWLHVCLSNTNLIVN
jgi:hypothetical protein